MKGRAHACPLPKSRAAGRPGVLTGEDLTTIGPVALLQDLAMMSLLGIEHVERNGHHYFRGLSPWPEAAQCLVQSAHGDLYRWNPAGFASLDIRDGRIALGSVNAAPFGVEPLLDPRSLEARPD